MYVLYESGTAEERLAANARHKHQGETLYLPASAVTSRGRDPLPIRAVSHESHLENSSQTSPLIVALGDVAPYAEDQDRPKLSRRKGDEVN
jgi:hypothetical protein